MIKLKQWIYFSLILLLAILSCKNKVNFDDRSIYGIWQSLNNKSSVVEFKENKDYNLYIDKESFYNKVEGYNQLKYKIVKINSFNNIEIETFNKNDSIFFSRIELQIIDKNRIRLYYLKHNHILDVADEYYRTDGFGHFDAIMRKFDTRIW